MFVNQLSWRYQKNRLAYFSVATGLLFSVVAPLLQMPTAKATAPQAPYDTAAAESIWPAAATPAHATSGDSNAVELGVKFKPAVNGTATGIRFYKGNTNTGTHVGHLWSAAGSQLAQVTFTNETATGWQSANFATPVQLTAGTTYVVSYYAPVGEYSYDSSPSDAGNLSNAVTNASGDLTALASGTSGGNGIYKYTSSPSGAFPSNTYANSNYWVDVVFTPGGTVAPPPPPTSANIYAPGYTPNVDAESDSNAVSLGVQFQSQTAGYISGVRFYKGSGNGGTHVGSLWTAKHTLLAQATFSNESASGWQDVTFSDMIPVAANTTYIASYFAPQGHYSYTANGLANGITNAPLVALPGSSTAGGNGVYSYGIGPEVPINSTTGADYAVDVDFTTSYVAPTITQPTPRSGTQGSGSVLVLTDPNNHFSDNYCSAILQTKGIACASTDTGNLTTASVLSPYHTVLLADGAPLTSTQIGLINTWASGGGNFIAMRPADNLDSLLGIGNRSNILPDAYIKVDNTQTPGQGIDGQSLQYHGIADEHALAGARAVATLYSDASTTTSFPAVTTKTVGSGTASAWMFDLARSVVYTREGNPGLAGQSTTSPGYSGYPRVPDRFGLGYLDSTKVAVPQADLQVSLLANQIETTQYPVPMKWSFPSYKIDANHPNGLLKAAFVLTGDDHASGSSQTLTRFKNETTASPAGCTVVAWTCIRSTSYAYPGAFSDSDVKPYTDAGFEVSPHVADSGNCASNWTTQAALDNIVNAAFSAWQKSYPTISSAYPPITQRFHCYGVWNDYATVAKEEAAHGLTADMNSACWPNSLFNVGQCLYTGSGLPQNIADSDGTLTGVNQFATQATDENPTTVDQNALNTLITNATGTNGYYGYFTVLAHLDNQDISNRTETAVLNVAAANDVPVISGAQAQTFWAGRSATTVSSPTYGTSTVTFSVTNPVANLLMLQPIKYGTKTLSTIKVGATTVAFGSQTISGVSYAVFPAASAGSYVATYR
ncbi:MAG TPA: DUF4082 domain-containing protein [Candidatus Saccharimonadales bacterium]|nr:DUF4082 domain-containing protein [Candidatus Saccharimonadales bacterium]